MRAIPLAVVLSLSLVVPGIAVAQQGRSGSGTMQPATSAPTGHRQPQAKDAPPADQQPATATDQAPMTAADRALDRALKGICRGC